MIFNASKSPLAIVVFVFLPLATLFAQRAAKPTDHQRACDSAKSQMDLNECAVEQYHKADIRLSVVYRKVLAFIQKDISEARRKGNADEVKYSQEALGKLQAAEVAWVHYRDLHCDAARHQIEGGSMSPMVWGFCMEQVTSDRIEELKQAYETGERKLE